MGDQLTEIDRKDLPILRDLYKSSNNSDSYAAYVTIDNYIRIFQEDSSVKNIQFYCLNGDFSRGTFVVTDLVTAHADTLNESTDELHRLLCLLDYSKGYFFKSLHSRVASVVTEVIKQQNLELFADLCNLNYFLTKETALQFDVQPPNGIELRPLTKRSDIEKAYSAWPGNCLTAIQFLMRSAKYNPNIGAFKEDGTLVAWVFRMSTGLLLALQTDKEHYNHGYGSLVVKAISKQIAQMGHDIHAGINVDNTPSRALFEKLGFKAIRKVHWISTKFNWNNADETPLTV